MTKSKSILNKLTAGQILNLVYPDLEEYPFYYIVENGVVYVIDEGKEV